MGPRTAVPTALCPRAELDIDGQTYVLVTGNVSVPSDPQYCASAQWNLYRKGLVHPI